MGVSVENDARKYRLDDLRNTPAKLKWISFEPLVGKISNLDLTGIDWAVIGGESGEDEGKYKYREAELDWFYEIMNACNKYGTKIYIKQMGSFIAKKVGMSDFAGKKMSEFPIDLRLQEFPA